MATDLRKSPLMVKRLSVYDPNDEGVLFDRSARLHVETNASVLYGVLGLGLSPHTLEKNRIATTPTLTPTMIAVAFPFHPLPPD